jgi:hypothetical protein
VKAREGRSCLCVGQSRSKANRQTRGE